MPRIGLAVVVALSLFVAPLDARAQEARVHHVGVVVMGGLFTSAIAGLRDGLKELGLDEGKQVVFHVRDGKGDLELIEVAAKDLEREGVDVIYSVGSTVTVAVKRATKSVPIVFESGVDPVALHLVESFPKPGGRLTGIHSQSSPLAAKRLELLTELLPRLRRVLTFYNPNNLPASANLKIAQDAARRLNIELVAQRVVSVEELRTRLRAIRPGVADAFLYLGDALVASQADMVIDATRAKKLPAMFHDPATVAKGALASYGISYYALGRFSARHVQRVLLGANPSVLPIEQSDRLHFAVNLKTAKTLGLTIPQSVLLRADQVIE